MSLLRLRGAVAAEVARSSSHFIVTGAGGWFGTATLEMLEQALGAAFESRVSAFGRARRTLVMRSGRRVDLQPLVSLADMPRPTGRVHMLHYAFLTREKTTDTEPQVYIDENRRLTSFVERQCRRLQTNGTFSTSSGAVYRPDGRLDTDLATNPYGVLKLEEEAAFGRLNADGAATAICRVFNVGGPLLNKEYAIGSLIRGALFEGALTIRARHQVFRSYAHIGDIVSVGVAVATGLIDAPTAPYDTAGMETVEIEDLARRVKEQLDCREKPIVRDRAFDLPADRYVGDPAVFAMLAGKAGIDLASLDEQIDETARFLAADHLP